ncbi:hypothetical protein KKH81_02995 [Patescibacteria group bacterium]|nr:hypothetical protein [Patescibacteria group bacterium]
MSDYDEFRKEVREGKRTVWTVLPTIVGVIIVLALLGFALNSFGLFGKTVVERKVFEQSYQRSSAIESQIATDTAALAEIDRQLQNPHLDENTRVNLEAQASAARARIDSAERRK